MTERNPLDNALATSRNGILRSVKGSESVCKEIASQIREYSRMQTPLWKQIPNLALEADGRDGSSDEMRIMYKQGGMRVLQEHGSYGDYLAIVRFDDGEIFDLDVIGEDLAQASDELVFRFTKNMEELDARVIVEALKIRAKAPYSPSYISFVGGSGCTQAKIEKWRANFRREKRWHALTPKDLRPEQVSPEQAQQIKMLNQKLDRYMRLSSPKMDI